MQDNCYAYVIDASIDKGKDGNYSELLVFECQPLLSSNLGGSSEWSYKNAFKKAFPDANIAIDIQGNKTNVIADQPLHRILIKNSERISTAEFVKISQVKHYKHIHTGSFEVEIDKLNNKVYQRLYLPDEVSPEYRILPSKTATETLAEDIFNYFSAKGINKIVLKSAVGHEGKGNIFINDIQDKEALKIGIKNIQSINQYPSDPNTKYFLAEEQKEFTRVSRKTGESKSGHLSYRLVGIANQDEDIGHFIASKSISQNIDSHQREKMTCYFGIPGETHNNKAGWSLEARGTKDKYFGLGEDRIEIDPSLMKSISKRIYQLYADIKTLSDETFEQHIDKLVIRKNALSSREEKITHFTIEAKTENELVNTHNLLAYSRAVTAYPRLAAFIASEMVKTHTVALSNLAELPYYNIEDIDPFLNAMRNKKQFDGLKTANSEQLNYCIEEYAFQDMQIPKIAKQLVEKMHKEDPEKQKAQVDTVEPPVESCKYRSRLLNAFSAGNPHGEATATSSMQEINRSSAKESEIQKLGSRLAKSTLFTMPQDAPLYKGAEKELEKFRLAAKKF